MRSTLLALLVLLALPATAQTAPPAEAVLGVWGDAARCEGDLLIEGGTKRAAPFEIGPDWLRHGEVWCKLGWFPGSPRNDGIFVTAQALCGEDSVQPYRLDMDLSGSELTLIWDEALINGPFGRCD